MRLLNSRGCMILWKWAELLCGYVLPIRSRQKSSWTCHVQRNGKALSTSQTSCMAPIPWLQWEVVFFRYWRSPYIPSIQTAILMNELLQEQIKGTASLFSMNQQNIKNFILQLSDCRPHGNWSVALQASATVKLLGPTETETYMVQILGFVFALWVRDPLKPLELPQLRAGWPQISFGLVACIDWCPLYRIQ